MAAGPWAPRSGAAAGTRYLCRAGTPAISDTSPLRTARKVLLRAQSCESGWIGPKVADYFPTPDPVVKHPIMRMAHDSERVAALEARKNTGRGVPKKGEGKRSGKK